jgi:hypothetical protein
MNPLQRVQQAIFTPRGLVLLFAILGILGFALVRAVAAESPAPGATVTLPPLPTPGATVSQSATPVEGPSATQGNQPSEAPVPAASPPAAITNSCYECHKDVNQTQHDLAGQWAASVHGQNGIACASCHGGDPTSDQVTVAMSPAKGFIGAPSRAKTVLVCGTCHSNVDTMRQYQIPTDQLVKYQASVHGLRLATGDDHVAICTDCHGVHDIKKASDPTAKVYPLNVPALCASCHADPKTMAPYGIPTNQYTLYQASVHGVALLQNQDLRAPTCASCHGSHDARPPNSTEVVQVCGNCHTATQALYEQSRHSQLEVGPKCWTCHGTHDVAQPNESRFFHPAKVEIDCTTCHSPIDQSLKLNATQFANDADRRCDTCHHPNSVIYAQAQGLHDTLDRANTAYQQADARIKEAAAAGMIVTDADVAMTEAQTSLIQARAAVHTTKLTTVATLADAATAKAQEAQAFADAKLEQSLFRREAMVVVLGVILINVLVLFMIKRRIDRNRAET